jgi:serine/threonine protein kinase
MPYLAPERVDPGAYWDALADIYSLGALIYARLTGRPPLAGPTPGATIEQILRGKIDLPQKYVKETPDRFQTVILKMLARNQEDRYPTPAYVLDRLMQVQASA